MESVTENKLGNGVTISVSDHSRKIAADRWYIKIVCQCSIEITEDLISSKEEDSPEIADCIRRELGDTALLELVRERNFIAEGDKDQVVSEIHDKISDLASGYLSSELFTRKLFASSYDEAKMKCLAGGAAIDGHQEECDEGPADFSECFRD